jgi:hemerythrin
MLQAWLKNHILKEDIKIVAFIEKNKIEIKNNALPK